MSKVTLELTIWEHMIDGQQKFKIGIKMMQQRSQILSVRLTQDLQIFLAEIYSTYEMNKIFLHQKNVRVCQKGQNDQISIKY